MKENIPEFLYEMLIKEYGENISNKIIKGYSYTVIKMEVGQYNQGKNMVGNGFESEFEWNFTEF